VSPALWAKLPLAADRLRRSDVEAYLVLTVICSEAARAADGKCRLSLAEIQFQAAISSKAKASRKIEKLIREGLVRRDKHILTPITGRKPDGNRTTILNENMELQLKPDGNRTETGRKNEIDPSTRTHKPKKNNDLQGKWDGTDFALLRRRIKKEGFYKIPIQDRYAVINTLESNSATDLLEEFAQYLATKHDIDGMNALQFCQNAQRRLESGGGGGGVGGGGGN
jgi:hypothetical protein